MKTLLLLTVANIKSLTRDKAALFWTFLFPVMFVFLFGAIFSGSGNTKIAIGFVDEDKTMVSAGLKAGFDQVTLFDVRVGTREAELDAMAKGEVSAVIIIPRGLQDASINKTPISLTVYTDPTNTQVVQIVDGIVDKMTAGFNLRLANGAEILTRPMQDSTITVKGLTSIGYLVPSILAMALMQMGVFAAIPLVQQKEKGILKRLGATPLRRWTLIGSNILTRLIVAIGDAILILGVGSLVFGVSVGDNVLAVAGLTLLGAGVFLAIGFMLAAFLKTEDQASGVVQIVQIPMMFLSGIFFSFEFLPGVMQTIARFLPLTYLADAFRQVMVSGTPVAPLGFDVAVLVGWLVVCLGISAKSFRWE
jgi:ABC-2 type transport system permease protein